MTQGIQQSTRPYDATRGLRATRTSDTADRPDRHDNWFVKVLDNLRQLVVGHPAGRLPAALLEDVGLRAASPEIELRGELNRLDASLRARIY